MNNKNTDLLTIRDLWDIFRYNILLFVLSVSISISISIVYVLVTPPLFQRSASILIKDDSQGKSVNLQSMQEFDYLGLSNVAINLNNELNIIRTLSFMETVVGRLGLDYSYGIKQNNIRWIDLYTLSPFKVVVDSTLENSVINFEIEFNNSHQYIISNLTIDQYEVEGDIEGEFGVDAETGYGNINISNTLLFSEPTSVGQLYQFSKSTIKTTAKKHLGHLSVVIRSKDASIIDLSITDENPQKAEHILNTLISVYNENWLKDKNEITYSTSDFIDDRISVIEAELGAVDGDISDFKSSNLLPDVSVAATIHLDQSTENKKRLLNLNNQLYMARYIKEYIDIDISENKLLPSNSGIENSAIEAQICKYNELLLHKNIFVANSGDQNPLVIDMVTTLAALKGVINKSIEDLINTLSIQVKNVKVEEIENRHYLAENPKQAKDLLGVERQQRIKQELYLFLLKKREENELAQAFSAYNTKVLSLADGLNSPVKPRKQIIMFLALVIGMGLPVVLLIIKESLNTIVKSKKDLNVLTIPFVGSIPFIEYFSKYKTLFKKNKKTPVLSSISRSISNESFRVVRTNLDFMMTSKNEAQLIQSISINPSSGKSFVIANLGVSMALKGAKVLIIDADMRKATLSKYFGNTSYGISDYLSHNSVNIEDIIVKSELHSNVDFLPVGTIPPNPSELLLTSNFEELITKMKTCYDYIFLDCPPVDIVPDAAIIAKYCDVSIFVIRAGLLDKRLLPDVQAVYESKKYNNMCLLLNAVRYNNGDYYSYQEYGYGSDLDDEEILTL